MTTTNTEIPEFPRVTAIFHDHAVEVTLLGVSRMFEGEPADARSEALRFLWDVAKGPDFARPLRVHTTTGSLGDDVALIVTPEGRYYDESDPKNAWPINNQATTEPDQDLDVLAEVAPQPAPLGIPAPVVEVDQPGPQLLAGPSVPRHHERKSFIADGPVLEPAKQGWPGFANKIGLRLNPATKELMWREDVKLVSQHWPGPRTIAIANGKGSANKTPTTVMLAAVLARFGGAGVLAWDNNETRGSLAWRTQRSNHTSTVLDLLPRAESLLGTGAQSAEMSYFAHHQPEDKFDVLHSDQSVDGEHEVSGAEVDAIHRVAAKYYRMIIMDSGNNERAVNWRAMIERSQQLVVPCTNVEDTAEAGARMLEALANRDEHSRKLAQNAVAIISKRTPGKDPNMDRIVKDFAPLVREVVTIPYDKALVSGVIHFDALNNDTKRAWLRGAAAVAKGL